LTQIGEVGRCYGTGKNAGEWNLRACEQAQQLQHILHALMEFVSDTVHIVNGVSTAGCSGSRLSEEGARTS